MSIGTEIAGSRDLTILERALADRWDIPAAVLKAIPLQLAQIAAGATTMPSGKPWSLTARVRATRCLSMFIKDNLSLGRLQLDAWKAQQPGEMSFHSLANVVDQITRAARERFGDSDDVREFEKQLLADVLQAARLQQGTSLLPSELEAEVRGMDESIPDGEP